MSDNKQIQQRNENYGKYVNAVTPKSSVWHSLLCAFITGGITCAIAQGIGQIFTLIFPNMEQEMVATIVSAIIISLAILLTGFGVFDRIAKFGGAGAFLPITGFANAMASASMEFKTEGMIFGTSTKMFTVVGPVVVNGVVWSALVGVIYFIIGLF